MTDALTEYWQLYKELLELDREGKGETVEADAIRDRMDGPWYRLSEDDQDTLDEIIGELESQSSSTAYAYVAK